MKPVFRPKNPTSIALAGLLWAGAAATAADVRDGLVSYWPLDALDNGVAADAAFTNHLTAQGTPVVGPGQFGNAFTFDGATTYLTNLHASDGFAQAGLPIYQAGAYTICMWVKGPPQTAKYLYTEGSLASTTPIFLLQSGQTAANNAKFDVLVRTDGNTTLINHVVSSNVVFDNTWHHIAWVDDNGNARLYVDGQLDPVNFSYNRAGAFTFSSSTIGTLVRTSVATGGIFNGQIDEVAFWERPLSQAEVDFVRTNGIPAPVTPRPPSLYALPQDTTRAWGDWALFSVRAYASRPNNAFTYQWSKNGAPIPDATARTYQTPHLTTADSGSTYSVSVSSPLGTTNTPIATLTVLPDPASDLRLGLVSHWPLDEITEVDSGLRTPDLYSHTDFVLLNFLGTSDVVPGQRGNALNFDFVTRLGYRTNGSAIYNNTNYSVSLWVQGDYTSQNDRRVYSEGSPTNNNPLFTLGTESTGTTPSASVFIRNDAGAAPVGGRQSTRPVFDGAWHHLVWTDANGQGKLYVDGTLDETDYTYTRGALNVSQTAIGAVLRGTNTGNFFFGNIDEVTAWNRVLTWTEIQEVLSQGVPPPLAAIAPTIATQPQDRTNNVFTGDNVSFTVVANGTFPLSFQWRKDDVAIPAPTNPTATTDTLVLNSAQLADNGLYSVVITNSAGAVTSNPVRLTVQSYTPIGTGEVLRLDIGAAGAPNVQPGFSEFTLDLNGTNYGGVGVSVFPIGSISLAARNRNADPYVTNRPPALTQASIYNDFIFASSAVEGNGLGVRVERLAPGTPYGVTLWSFDPASTGSRVADWTETSSGTPIPVVEAYTFVATNLPASDHEYTFGGVFMSSSSGRLQFEGRRNAASVNAAGNNDIGVFLNAIRLVARPAGPRVAGIDAADGKLTLRLVGDYPGQSIELEQSPSLATGSWSAAPATIISTNGPQVTFEVPLGSGSMFFRGKGVYALQ